MTEETAKKTRNTINILEQYRKFLKEYDQCQDKMIAVRRDCLSGIGDMLDFSFDSDFKKVVREYVVSKIEDLEKQLEEL